MAVRKHIAANTDTKAIKFVTCATANPPKLDVLAYLGIPLITGEKAQVLEKELLRRADVDVSSSIVSFRRDLKLDKQFIDIVTGYV